MIHWGDIDNILVIWGYIVTIKNLVKYYQLSDCLRRYVRFSLFFKLLARTPYAPRDELYQLEYKIFYIIFGAHVD